VFFLTKLAISLCLILSAGTARAENIIYYNGFDSRIAAENSRGLVQAYDPSIIWSMASPSGYYSGAYGGLVSSPQRLPKVGVTIVNQAVPSQYSLETRTFTGLDRGFAPGLIIFDWKYSPTPPYMNFKWATVVMRSPGQYACVMGEYHDAIVIKHTNSNCLTLPVARSQFQEYLRVKVQVNGNLAKFFVEGAEKMSYFYNQISGGPTGMAVSNYFPNYLWWQNVATDYYAIQLAPTPYAVDNYASNLFDYFIISVPPPVQQPTASPTPVPSP
jgi:hypothetical protein